MKKSKKAQATKAAQPRPNHMHGSQVGAAAGALAGEVLDREAKRSHAHDAELDDAIGVTCGDIGAPNVEHPPATVGAYSSASVGASTSNHVPAEGPIPVDGDE